MKRAPEFPRLGKEAVLQARNLSNPEIRFIVSNYYAAQNMRKRCDMQLRHLGEKALPDALRYHADAYAVQEAQYLKLLKTVAEASPIGQWCMSHIGIGPVISAGCMAHFDIEKAQTAGHFWSFAGLNPAKVWKEGEKRPWNAELKQIMWHLGQSMKKQSGKPHADYGRLYKERKTLLETRNANGDFAERCKTFRAKSPEWKKVIAEGRLPAGNIDSQACNFVSKIFLSHLHAVMYWEHFGTAPPKPFAIGILGHAHEIKIPNLDMFPGLEQAYYGGKMNGG